MNSVNSIVKHLLIFVAVCTMAYSQSAVLSYGNVDVDAGTMEIFIDAPGPLAGFQFVVTGVTLTSATGGIAGSTSGWQVSTSSNGTVLGFVFGTNYIPMGLNLLTVLSFSSFDGVESCITAGVASAPAGQDAYTVEYGDCFTVGGGLCDDLICDDGNLCTDDSCDDVVGCVYVDNTNACDDGNTCTSDDVCGDGFCIGMAIDCDDGDLCTDDSCDGSLGCQYVDNGNIDDCGVCFGTNDCVGCTDPLAPNYCSTCTIDDGSCEYPVLGVTFYYGAVDVAAGTAEVWMDTPGDIAGIQFVATGLTLTGASGGTIGN
ncbi:MAG: hypothetical protein HQ510_09240, partial [Candidatus Marinimicrobia bacterium]|nr:hypothetical protein [Candidatus Neomarinimicrobiota bacterium]